MTRATAQMLDEIISKMRSGRMKRRTFLEQVVMLGLTSSMATSVLTACGGSSESTTGNGAALNLVWQDNDATGTYHKLVDTFNRTNKDGVHVTFVNGSSDSTQVHSGLLNILSEHNNALDVLSLDIIWPAEFALNQWVVPLNDRWSAQERTAYLPGPLQGCTFGEQVWAAPFTTGAGLIYYRKDLIPTPPQTWDELANMAQQVRSAGKTKYGYVWQGAFYEGLVCDFAEVLYSYGGAVLDPNNPKSVIINSPEAVQALTSMVGWVGSISPIDVTSQKEDDAQAIWDQGEAAFMRNWPNAYASGNAATSKITDKFAVHSMPHGGGNTTGHSVIGGWQLAINAFSNPDKIDAAWKFIHYMIGKEAQKALALAALPSTLASVYKDQEVLTQYPFFKDLGDVLQTALPRPVTPRYPELTKAIQSRVHQALVQPQQSAPADALLALQNDLQFIVAL